MTRLPRLDSFTKLVDEKGQATPTFQRYWQMLVEEVERVSAQAAQLRQDVDAL